MQFHHPTGRPSEQNTWRLEKQGMRGEGSDERIQVQLTFKGNLTWSIYVPMEAGIGLQDCIRNMYKPLASHTSYLGSRVADCLVSICIFSCESIYGVQICDINSCTFSRIIIKWHLVQMFCYFSY
jgi:hypothetical protein